MYKTFISFCKIIIALSAVVLATHYLLQNQHYLENDYNVINYPLTTKNNLFTELFTNNTLLNVMQKHDTTASIFLFFFIFLFIIIFITITQSFITFAGSLYLSVIGCISLLAGLVTVYAHITVLKSVPLLELKLYSIYNPIYTVSVVFSLDYISLAFMFLVVAIAVAATLYARVYLYGDPNTVDFLVKLL